MKKNLKLKRIKRKGKVLCFMILVFGLSSFPPKQMFIKLYFTPCTGKAKGPKQAIEASVDAMVE